MHRPARHVLGRAQGAADQDGAREERRGAAGQARRQVAQSLEHPRVSARWVDGRAVSKVLWCVVRNVDGAAWRLIVFPLVALRAVWAKSVTDACLPALPAMAPMLDALYTAHFIHNGRTYPCHPELGAPSAGTDEERWLREARRADRIRKTSSPRSSIFF